MGAPMPEVSLRARKKGPQRFVHKGLCGNPSFPRCFWPFGAKGGGQNSTKVCAQRFVRNPSFPFCFWPFGAKRGDRTGIFHWKEAFAVTLLFSSSKAVGCLLLISNIVSFWSYVNGVIVAYPWLRGIHVLICLVSDECSQQLFQDLKKYDYCKLRPPFWPKKASKRPLSLHFCGKLPWTCPRCTEIIKLSYKGPNYRPKGPFWLQKAQKVHKGLCTNLCALVRPFLA